MKTLMNLKLFAMSLLLWAGMTSCLKGSDPDFMVVPDVAYLEQIWSFRMWLIWSKPVQATMPVTPLSCVLSGIIPLPKQLALMKGKLIVLTEL